MIIQQLQEIFNLSSSKCVRWEELNNIPWLSDIEISPCCIMTRLPMSDFRRLYFRMQIGCGDMIFPPVKNDCRKYVSIYRGSLIYFNHRYTSGQQITIMKDVVHSFAADEPGIFFIEYMR